MALPFVLSFEDLTATLTEFAVNGHECLPGETGEVNYSLNGTPISDGIAFEAKLVWTISAYCDQVTATTIERIWKRSEKRRTQLQAHGISVADHIKLCVEDAPRTRALAPDGTVTTLPGSGVSYPALYLARMFQPKIAPSFNGLLTHQVTFVLKELDRVAP